MRKPFQSSSRKPGRGAATALLWLLVGCASQSTSIGADAVLTVGDAEYSMAPAGGCRTPVFHPLTRTVCENSGDDYAAALEHPTTVGADRQFAFRVKAGDVDLMQVSLFAKNAAGAFEPQSTHTFKGHSAQQDLHDLKPDLYVIEVFTRTANRSNALYRFALSISP